MSLVAFLMAASVAMLIEASLPFSLVEMVTKPLPDWRVFMATAKGNGEVKSPEAILTVEAILAAKDLKEEVVDVPEWGGAIKIRSFTKRQQQEIREASMVNEELDTDRLEMFMFLRGVVEPKFSDDQYEQLREKNAGAIDSILSRIMELSGMTDAAQKRAEKSFLTRT